MDQLSASDIRDLLSLKPLDIAPLLEQRLLEGAKNTIDAFFTDPRYGSFVNLGTLQTDANALIMRWDTLHAFLRAAQKGSDADFRRAGYEAGVLYGVGVMTWLIQNTSRTRGRPGLPGESFTLLDTCLKIDMASGWGRAEIRKTSPPRVTLEWEDRVSVKEHFLAHELKETQAEEPRKRYQSYRHFWKGYLEATFSTALGTWYGLWQAEKGEVPLFAALCTESEDAPQEEVDLEIRGTHPLYAMTCLNLQNDLFCPYAVSKWRCNGVGLEE